MTKKERDLVLKDLCIRLLYRVIVHLKYDENTSVTRELGIGNLHDIMVGNAEGKPYLRPMSSMTEEEINEFHKLRFIHVNYGLEPLQCVLSVNEIDWLNAHHFDYRGLIEKGLALEASEGMYKID